MSIIPEMKANRMKGNNGHLRRVGLELSAWFAVMLPLWWWGGLQPIIFLQGWDLSVFPLAIAFAVYRLAPPPQIRWTDYLVFWFGLIGAIFTLRWGLSFYFYRELWPDDLELVKRWWAPLAALAGIAVRPLWKGWQEKKRACLGYGIAHAYLRVGLSCGVLLVSGLALWNAFSLDLLQWTGPNPTPLTYALSFWTLGLIPVWIIGTGLLVVLLLVMLGPYVMLSKQVASGITCRLASLSIATAQWSEMRPLTSVAVHGCDEVAQLQQNFNGMADQLNAAMNGLKHQREQLEALFAGHRQLMATVGHELRSPLAVIRGHLEQLDGRLGDGDSAQEKRHFATLDSQIQNLELLTEDFFVLARSQSGRWPVAKRLEEANKVVEECMHLWSERLWLRNKIRLHFNCENYWGRVPLDKVRFRQIITNLVHNAVRYTPPGGLILLALSRGSASWQLTVEDTGCGIFPEDLDRIWEPFFKPDRDPLAQSGLGLAIVKTLVESMDGRVDVTSNPGLGTSFQLRFPVETETVSRQFN